MAKFRVKLGLRNASDQDVKILAINVHTRMKDNPSFPDPWVDMDTLEKAIDEFTAAMQRLAERWPGAAAVRDSTRAALEDLIRKLAAYVDLMSKNDPAILTSSGFPAWSLNRAQSPLPKAAILSISNGHTAQLVLSVDAILNAACFQVQCAAISPEGNLGPWQAAGVFTNSRAMRINGLKPGTVYAFQVRAVGGSTGYGDWSDTVSHMCM
jgi:hypothetical protein